MTDWDAIRSLPVGTDLFHGTGSKEKFKMPHGPAFFSDTFSVGRYFATWHEGPKPRVLRFEVTSEIPRLVIIESKEDFDRLAESVGMEVGESTEERVDLVCSAGFDGWIIPNNYSDGADILLCDPAKWLKYVDEDRI